MLLPIFILLAIHILTILGGSSDKTIKNVTISLHSNENDCGRSLISNKEPSDNLSQSKIGSVPWNVGIYQRMTDHINYDMICGGTLISPNLVVSAAHCFGDDDSTEKIIMSHGAYKVAVGKYDINILIMDNNFTQIVDVNLIYVNDDYFGLSSSYSDDIAILLLSNNVITSDIVMPICMDWSKLYTIPNETVGKICGWGRTEEATQSPILLEQYLLYMDRRTCVQKYKNGYFVKYITTDKFCTSSKLGHGINAGAGGAGLSFVHNDLHYLTGVISSIDVETYKTEPIAVFTDVGRHIQWINNIYKNHTNTNNTNNKDNKSKMNKPIHFTINLTLLINN